MIEANLSVKEIFDVFETAKNSVGGDVLGKKIMEVYTKNFGGESSIFFENEGNRQYIDIASENMDEKFNKEYKRYYYKFDPLDLLGKKDDIRTAKNIVENIDYSNCETSEYYTDFLRPQKIHYKMLVLLRAPEGVLAKILLTKPKKKGNFTNQEIKNAAEITPYIVHALEMKKMKDDFIENNNLLEMIENNIKSGLILLDSSKKLIHMNYKAKELCRSLRKDSFHIRNIEDIHPIFVKDSIDMMEELNAGSINKTVLSRNRIFKSGENTFSVQSKLIPENDNYKKSKYLLININDIVSNSDVEHYHVSQNYKLSKREKEVLSYVIKGLTNIKIAEMLFISEVTVKKHLQNIYLKMNIKNRASLVQKILTGQDS